MAQSADCKTDILGYVLNGAVLIITLLIGVLVRSNEREMVEIKGGLTEIKEEVRALVVVVNNHRIDHPDDALRLQLENLRVKMDGLESDVDQLLKTNERGR